MFILPLHLLAAVFLAISSIIWYSLPTHMHEGQDDAVSLRIARSTFKVSQEAIDQLTNIQDESTGLLPLWKRAKNLTNEAWLTAEYRRLERKVCRGRIFNIKAVADECKGLDYLALSQVHLAQYYNELVIQLNLAQRNYDVRIAEEILLNYTQAALDNEKDVIKTLNESVLPALEFLLQLGSTDTDCSTTELLTNRIISQYTNCTVVQTSNMFLSQIALSLYHKLNSEKLHIIDNTVEYEAQLPDSSKQWCVVL